MTVSTDAILCYGFLVEEGTELPWMNDDYDELEMWWIDISGYKPQKNLVDLKSDDDFRDWYLGQQEWLKSHPLPIECVTHCSYNSPMYILAVPGTSKIAFRGSPTEIRYLPSISEEKRNALIKFCETYGIEVQPELISWWLCSLWG